MAGKFNVEVRVLYQERYDGGRFDFGSSYENGSLDRVITSLNAIRDGIPDEYRSVARCEIDCDSRWGDSFAKIEVTYNRPSTDIEEAEQEEEMLTRRRASETEDRRTLARLQAKYGSVESHS